MHTKILWVLGGVATLSGCGPHAETVTSETYELQAEQRSTYRDPRPRGHRLHHDFEEHLAFERDWAAKLQARSLQTVTSTPVDFVAFSDECDAGTGPCHLELEEGAYTWPTGLGLCHKISIAGKPNGLTQIHLQGPFTALPFEQCRNEGRPWMGSINLENLDFIGNKTFDCFFLQDDTRLRNVRVWGCRVGIVMDAGATRPIASNANLSFWQGVHIFDVTHEYLVITGADVNASTLEHIVMTPPACTDASCTACIRTTGFLGNSWVSGHSLCPGKPWIEGTNPNARESFFGHYVENAGQTGILPNVATVFGGFAAGHIDTIPGRFGPGPRTGPLIVEHGDTGRTWLGAPGPNGIGLAIYPPTTFPQKPLQLTFRGDTTWGGAYPSGVFTTQFGGLNSSVSHMWRPQDSVGPLGASVNRLPDVLPYPRNRSNKHSWQFFGSGD